MLRLGDGASEHPDYMLVEWAAALELEVIFAWPIKLLGANLHKTFCLQRRGTLKAVLPLIVAASGNFGAEAVASFGGLQALPDTVPDSTLEKVHFHLEETTGACRPSRSSTPHVRVL